MKRGLLGLLIIVSLVGLSGCSSAKGEAQAVVAGVERFHRASNVDRPASADALAAVACKDPEVCAARDACVTAATATASALRLKAEAEATWASVQAGTLDAKDPTVVALPAKLDQASQLLTTGRDAMPACDQKILVLRERYGL